MTLVVGDVRLDSEPVSVRAEGGVITELGPDVVARRRDTVVDGRGLALVPGLVNGHTHAAMTLLRGFGDDLPLLEWLRTRIWPAEARLEPDDVYWGTRLAALEMIRSGTVRFFDMYWHHFDAARAVVDAGLRAVISIPVIESPDAPEWNRIDAVPDGVERLRGFGPRVAPAVAAHAIYTVGEPSLRRLGELSIEHEVPLQMHLSETRDEVDDCLAAHGVRPAWYLDRLGLLTPHAVLAHGVWLDGEELALIADRGATIVTNPSSNMKLGVGRAFPYPDATAAGTSLAIGTDGAASNNSLDLLQEVKVLALLQKHARADPAVLTVAEAWRLVTGQASPITGGAPLRVGGVADFALVDTASPELAPADLLGGLVYSATGGAVDTVVVDGRVLMQHREVPDAEEVVARASECAARLRV